MLRTADKVFRNVVSWCVALRLRLDAEYRYTLCRER